MANRYNGEQACKKIQGFLDEMQSIELEEKIGELAVSICEEHKPLLRSSSKSLIKHPVSPKPYVNHFTVRKKATSDHSTYGATLWNTTYQLSHLIERPHYMWNTGGKSTNEYHMWEKQEEPMVQEFEEGVYDLVQDAINRATSKLK